MRRSHPPFRRLTATRAGALLSLLLAAVPAGALLSLLLAASPAGAQTLPADSAGVMEVMHEMQAEFERFRESRTPVAVQRADGVCDERIGRICIWFGDEEGEGFPAEFREVGQARLDLIRSLSDAFEVTPNRWLLGQWVHYVVESRNIGEAERVATECGIPDAWWCSALLGYVLHVKGEFVEAEAVFREALDVMPDSIWHAWTTPRYVFTNDAVNAFNAAAPLERDLQFNLLWRLSDPLFLVEGNDRFTDHFARWVVAENRRDAADPLGMEWDPDLEETLVRYGRNTGYSRTHDPGRTVAFGGGLQDTRRMVGHHHPKSRGYLFPEVYLESPSDIPAESWITAPREARTWYAPPYAPDIRGLETQVGRFRRDDRMLVVGAYRPTLVNENEPDRVVAAWSPEGGIQSTAYAAIFLIPVDGGPQRLARGSDPEGVMTLEAVPGRYVSGIEVVDLAGRQAWRARQGVAQLPLVPGLPDVSDLMILKEGAPLPETLDEALPHVRPGVRLRVGERFPVIWEVYGLRILEPVRVTIGFSRGRPGFLTRIGDFLGVIEPEGSVDVSFDETGPDQVQAVFRSIELQLPDLDPGEYTLHLRLDLPGRTPVVTSRPIIVER